MASSSAERMRRLRARRAGISAVNDAAARKDEVALIVVPVEVDEEALKAIIERRMGRWPPRGLDEEDPKALRDYLAEILKPVIAAWIDENKTWE